MAEQWKAVPEYEGWYEVSDHGRVRRTRSQRQLKLTLNSAGYPRVDLSRDNKQVQRQVHRLVLEAFVGPGDGRRMQACHYNGNRQDNRLENLRWGTPSENALDRSRHGMHRGGRRKMLTEDEVRIIKTWPRYGRGLYAAFPSVSKSAIDAIRSGYNYKDVHGSPS
jgi:hypothetical protein